MMKKSVIFPSTKRFLRNSNNNNVLFSLLSTKQPLSSIVSANNYRSIIPSSYFSTQGSSSSSSTNTSTTMNATDKDLSTSTTTTSTTNSGTALIRRDKYNISQTSEYMDKLVGIIEKEAQTASDITDMLYDSYSKKYDTIAEKDEIYDDTETDIFFDEIDTNPKYKYYPMGELIHSVYSLRNIKKLFFHDAYETTGILLANKDKPFPTVLQTNLLTAIQTYCSKSTTLIDYHPHSDNKVQDIVHPSLYPYVHGLSKIDDKYLTDTNFLTTIKPNLPQGKPDIKSSSSERQMYISPKFDRWGRVITNSEMYQWLPTDIHVNKEGKIQLLSYINNLPQEETKLYQYITEAMEYILPYFQLSWKYTQELRYYYNEDYHSDKPYTKDINDINNLKNLYNRNLQIITKIVKIDLEKTDDKQSSIIKDKDNDQNEVSFNPVLKGAWHAEGMSNEAIVATASITLDQAPQVFTYLNFQRQYTEHEHSILQGSMPQNPIHYVENFLREKLVPLGRIPLRTSDVVIFPNSHIHKLDMDTYENIYGNQPHEDENLSYRNDLTRTILVFWLIDPSKPILSTSHIKEQYKYNPEFTLEKAYEHRLKLMNERTKVKQNYNQPDLNLCEH